MSRKRNARGRSQSEKLNRPPCEYFLKGTCTKSPCLCSHPPECQFYTTKSGCKFGAQCSFPHWKVEEQPNKKPKKGDDKSAVAIVKSVRQLSCVSQDTRAPLRQANIRENQGPTLNKIQVKIPHQQSPHAMKCEDRSPGETARQERCARGDAWELTRNIDKLKKEDKSHILFAF